MRILSLSTVNLYQELSADYVNKNQYSNIVGLTRVHNHSLKILGFDRY